MKISFGCNNIFLRIHALCVYIMYIVIMCNTVKGLVKALIMWSPLPI